MTDRLLASLTPGIRAEMGRMIAGCWKYNDLAFCDWLTDNGVVDTLDDVIRLYAPDPVLGLERDNVTDWEFVRQDVGGPRSIPAQLLTTLAEVVQRHSPLATVMPSPFAEHVLAYFLNQNGETITALKVQEETKNSHLHPALPAVVWPLFLGTDAYHTGFSAPRTGWRWIGPQENIPFGWACLHQEPRYTEPWNEEIDASQAMMVEQFRINKMGWLLPGRPERSLDLWVGQCPRCGMVYWGSRYDELLAQPDWRRQVLDLPFFRDRVLFESGPVTLNTTADPISVNTIVGTYLNDAGFRLDLPKTIRYSSNNVGWKYRQMVVASDFLDPLPDNVPRSPSPMNGYPTASWDQLANASPDLVERVRLIRQRMIRDAIGTAPPREEP